MMNGRNGRDGNAENASPGKGMQNRNPVTTRKAGGIDGLAGGTFRAPPFLVTKMR